MSQPLKNCYACGGAQPQPVRAHEPYTLYNCSGCGFQFWYPIAQASREYFENSYTSFSDVTQKPFLGLRHRLLLAQNPITQGAVLDIGCGDGALLAELSKKGFETWGIDFNRGAIEKARTLFDLKNLHALSIYEFADSKDRPSFDLVTFFELLEHVENPEQFIRTIKGLLKPGGYIALSIPNAGVFGPWEYAHNAPPYHTAYWTSKTLATFLRHNGFEMAMLKKIEKPDMIPVIMNLGIRSKLTKVPSVARTASAGASSRGTGSGAAVAKQAMRLALRPFEWGLRAVGYRPVIFAIAKLK